MLTHGGRYETQILSNHMGHVRVCSNSYGRRARDCHVCRYSYSYYRVMKFYIVAMFLIGFGFALPNGWVVMGGGLVLALLVIREMWRVSNDNTN